MSETHLRAVDYVVRPVEDVHRASVEAWHYSRSTSTVNVRRHGLYRRLDADTLVGPLGVALWMPPTKPAARAVAGDYWRGVLNLSRLAVEPGMPTNAASFLLGRSMRLIDRHRWPGLLTYADTRHGHTGAIYLATNWILDREVNAGALWLGPDGEQRGTKRGPRNLTRQEMEAAGFTYHPPVPKIRFVHWKDKKMETKAKLSALRVRLRANWSGETSATPGEWTPENPARGQCAVSALVVQDFLGGDLMRGTVGGESHYWNRLPDGREVDLALEQFGGFLADAAPVVRDRDYVLSFEETRRRYDRLRSRV